MVRTAWNACRSCSAASLSIWADSLARKAEAGWISSERCAQQLGHRVLGQPVHLEAGPERTQLVGDGQVTAGVAEADGRGHIEHPLGPVQRPGPGPPGRPDRVNGPEAAGEVMDGVVDHDRLPGRSARPRRPSRSSSSPPVRAASRSLRAHGSHRSSLPVDGQHRDSSPGPGCASVSSRDDDDSGPYFVRQRRSPRLVSRAQPTQSSRCLVECGSGSSSPKRNSSVAAPVAPASSPWSPWPSLRSVS